MYKKILYKHIPESPGVYIMKGEGDKILYIGKAANLKRRVSSYFTHSQNTRIARMVSKIRTISYKKTNSALEALILEANLIKKHQPPFNVLEKDDKSFIYVAITQDEFPRVVLIRGKELSDERSKFKFLFGPFVSSRSLKEALRIIRKIFPWSIHDPTKRETRPCFDYQIGLCPGTCIGAITKEDYMKNIYNFTLFLSGNTGRVARNLEVEMKRAARLLEFEKAEKIKRQLFALQHINDVSILNVDDLKSDVSLGKKKHTKHQLTLKRIEGYDISNISGKNPVGSMVVFTNGGAGEGEEWIPNKSEYRKFAIRGKNTPDDVHMLQEVIERRLNHQEWIFPDLILIDGGKGQVNIVRGIIKRKKMKIPVLGMVKGKDRKGTDIIGTPPKWVPPKILVRIRDEAHRFAISYHRTLRSVTFIPKGRT